MKVKIKELFVISIFLVSVKEERAGSDIAALDYKKN